MKHLPLTARGYEIEYDLLFSSLENKIKIGFTKTLQTAQRTATDFGYEIDESAMKQCISKIAFIVYRLGFEKSIIPKIIDEYVAKPNSDTDKLLPDSYIKEMKNFALSYEF